MDDKTCTICHRTQPASAFSRSSRAQDGLQSRCRACARDWYLTNQDAHKANTARRTREVREEYHQRLLAHLAQHPCVDCGEDDVVLLEFDHRDPTDKVREVARLISDLVAWSTVEAEIGKCDVCCANCHRRRTARRGGQRRHRFQQQRRADEAAVLDALFAEVMSG